MNSNGTLFYDQKISFFFGEACNNILAVRFFILIIIQHEKYRHTGKILFYIIILLKDIGDTSSSIIT